MRVQTKQFPNCCNAAVIYGLGGTHTTLYGRKDFNSEALREELKKHIENYTASGYSMLCCTINSDQKDAQDVLEKMGFQGTGWMKKKVHPETCLQMYWKPLFGGIIPNSEEHQEWIEEQEEPTDLELEEIEEEEETLFLPPLYEYIYV